MSAEKPDGAPDGLDPAAEPPCAKTQSRHVGGKHRRGRVDRIAENEPELPEPQQFVDQRGEAGKKEQEMDEEDVR